MVNLKDFKEQLAKQTFGMTKAEAHMLKVCISCRKSILDKPVKDLDLEEYWISGLCSDCFERITA